MQVCWCEWTVQAFRRAERERKPVLLSLVTAWSEACAAMDRTTYTNPSVAQLIEDEFVAVRVDGDCRPDLNERYNLGGWPTTAFLTSGGDILSGGTYLDADEMTGVLRRWPTKTSRPSSRGSSASCSIASIVVMVALEARRSFRTLERSLPRWLSKIIVAGPGNCRRWSIDRSNKSPTCGIPLTAASAVTRGARTGASRVLNERSTTTPRCWSSTSRPR